MDFTKKELEALEASGAKVKIIPKDVDTFQDALSNLVKTNVDTLTNTLTGIKEVIAQTVANESAPVRATALEAKQSAADLAHLLEAKIKEAEASAASKAAAIEAETQRRAAAIEATMADMQKKLAKPPKQIIKNEIVERIVEKAQAKPSSAYNFNIHRSEDGRMSAIVARGDGTSPSYKFQIERDDEHQITGIYAQPVLM